MDAITTQVLNRFSALCAIPRPSGGEAAVTTYPVSYTHLTLPTTERV